MRSAAFFPPGLHPVLDGGEGDEDAVVAPEMPTGDLIGQAVFHHQADGHGDDPGGVMAAWWGEVGHSGVEVAVASGAVVLGVSNVEAAWAVAEKAAEVVQRAVSAAMAVTGTVAARARPAAVVTGAPHDQ